jgi:hypothetical protein
MVGKPLPFLSGLPPGNRLKRGRWVVLLVDPNCGKCRDVLPRFVQKYAVPAGISPVLAIVSPRFTARAEAAKPASDGSSSSDGYVMLTAEPTDLPAHVPLAVVSRDGLITEVISPVELPETK